MRTWTLSLGIILMIGGANTGQEGHPALAATPSASRSSAGKHAITLATLPLRFERNVGQAPAVVEYIARGQGYDLALARNGLILNLRCGIGSCAVARVSLDHAAARPSLRAEGLQTSVSNYFIGNDRSRWHANVANYRAVRYQQVYPGIDWLVYGNPQRLEYDFIVAPRANPQRIRLRVSGADALSLTKEGELLIKIHGETLRQPRPVMYQMDDSGMRHSVAGRYVADHRRIAFAVDDYDHSRALIIDPVLVYSTYLGGSGAVGDTANAIAVDSAGNAYVAGTTSSVNFPLADALQAENAESTSAGLQTAFITKFNASGSALIYSTYLGGSGDISLLGDGANAIAIDSAGNVYVAGYTGSSDFPTYTPYQGVNNARHNYTNAFLSKLNTSGDALVYSTFLGGSGNDAVNAIAVDSSGSAYVAGSTGSRNFPTVDPFQSASKSVSASSVTAFVTKFSAAGTVVEYSTYLGGNGTNAIGGTSTVGGDNAQGIAVDGAGNAYIAGTTASTDFPTVNALQRTNRAALSAFVTKLDATGSSLVYSTYLGGSVAGTSASAISVDGAGDAYIAGGTSTTDFPTVHAIQSTLHGNSNAFVSELAASGETLVYSTYLGGGGSDSASSIALDAKGNVYLAGSTTSDNFPLLNPVQATNNAAAHNASDAFITVVNPASGAAVKFSTYLGGSGVVGPNQPVCISCTPIYVADSAMAVAVDGAGNIYVAGSAFSTDFPTVSAFQDSNQAASNAHGNAFVAKIEPASAEPTGAPLRGGGLIGWGLISVLGFAVAARLVPSRGSDSDTAG